jgi:uncharacterized protein
MLIEYDSDKREKTLSDRGLDFYDAHIVWSGQHFTKIDNRVDYGEERLITVGLIQSTMVIIAWTRRGKARRIISMRKCNEREQTAYKQQLK